MQLRIGYEVNTQTALSQTQSGTLGRNERNYTTERLLHFPSLLGSTWATMIVTEPMFVRDSADVGHRVGCGEFYPEQDSHKPFFLIICSLSSAFSDPLPSLTFFQSMYHYLTLYHLCICFLFIVSHIKIQASWEGTLLSYCVGSPTSTPQEGLKEYWTNKAYDQITSFQLW